MSVIAVSGIPAKWDLKGVVLSLVKLIRGQFEALNFGDINGTTKTVYLQLSDSLQPDKVVNRINNGKIKRAIIKAYIPDRVPKLEISKNRCRIPLKIQKKLNLLPKFEYTPEKVIVGTQAGLLEELLCKYTGLYELSMKSNHALLTNITQTIVDRLKIIIQANKQCVQTYYRLSQAYRKVHPHFADFQLILSSLHPLEDAAGLPRSNLMEHELMNIKSDLTEIGDIPYEKIQGVSHKYASKISNKLNEYLNSLQSIPNPQTPEEIARSKIRKALIKTKPYVEMIVRNVITDNFDKDTFQPTATQRMRIYGEPSLPPKEVLTSTLASMSVTKYRMGHEIYNMIMVNIPRHKYSKIMALDGTVLNGNKLIVRSSNFNVFKTPRSMFDEIFEILNIKAKDTPADQPMQSEEMGNWTEEW